MAATNEVAKIGDKNLSAAMLERVLVDGNIAALSPQQRMEYYKMRCDAAGLDYRAQPFAYMQLQGKLTLYCTKAGAQQLCSKYRISTSIVNRRVENDLVFYTVTARTPDGQSADDEGFATTKGLVGEALGNANLKALTKAKRRAVLSLCGLGEMDETEVDSIAGAVKVNLDTGEEVVQEPKNDKPAPSSEGGVVSATRKPARVNRDLAEAQPPPSEEPPPDEPSVTYPETLADGIFIRSGKPEADFPYSPDEVSDMGTMFLDHWTNPDGSIQTVDNIRKELARAGYFTVPKKEEAIRKLFNKTLSLEELDKKIRTKGPQGKTPLEAVGTDREVMLKLCARDAEVGEIARHAVKTFDSMVPKSEPAPAKAPPAKAVASATAKAAAVKAKVAPPKKTKEQVRAEKLREAFKAAGKEIDDATVAQYVEAASDLDDSEAFDAFVSSMLTD